MGTRGTLRVYVDGELKIRQYNQWDSYPTGQFKTICAFMSDRDMVAKVYDKLKATRFFTDEEMKRAEEILGGSPAIGSAEALTMSDFYYLRNRDWGAKILYEVAIMPVQVYDRKEGVKGYIDCHWKEDTMGYIHYRLPDWAKVFDEEGDSLKEEGNYVIDLRKGEDAEGNEQITFRLCGDWHDVEREFGINEIPTDAEIQAWEEEGYGE